MEIQTSFFHKGFDPFPLVGESSFQLQNRRYIGNKYKLTDWIFSTLNKEGVRGIPLLIFLPAQGLWDLLQVNILIKLF